MCYYCLDYKREKERKTGRQKLLTKGYKYCPYCGRRIKVPVGKENIKNMKYFDLPIDKSE